MQRGRRVLVLTHRQEIADQVEVAVAMADVSYGKIAAGIAEIGRAGSDRLCSDLSAAEVPRALAQLGGPPNHRRMPSCRCRLMGEGHCLAGPGAGLGRDRDANATRWPRTSVAVRHDGLRPVGRAIDRAGMAFDATSSTSRSQAAPICRRRKSARATIAIEDQREAMDGVVIGAAVTEYQRICPGVPAVVFCVDIDHSQRVAEVFRAAGVRAAHVDGETGASDRRSAIAGLANGTVDVICNCGLITEGVDVPAIGAAILLRPTASLALYLQQVGRALRPAPGKERA